MWTLKYTQTYAWAINAHVHTCRHVKAHKLTSAYPCNMYTYTHTRFRLLWVCIDTGFCAKKMCCPQSDSRDPGGNRGPLSSCKVPKSGPLFLHPQNGSVQRFLFKLAKPYLLSLGHIFYFSIYMVIFLNFASYRNVQTCMKVENPPDRPCASITKDAAPPVSALQFPSLCYQWSLWEPEFRSLNTLSWSDGPVDPRRSSINQKAKPAISQAEFWVPPAVFTSNAFLKIK